MSFAYHHKTGERRKLSALGIVLVNGQKTCHKLNDHHLVLDQPWLVENRDRPSTYAVVVSGLCNRIRGVGASGCRLS